MSLCFKGRKIIVREESMTFFFLNVSFILLKEIIPSTSAFKSAAQNL